MTDVFVKLENVTVRGVNTSQRANSLKQFLCGKGSLESNLIDILEDISFEAYPGDRIGILGYNGSGKSSLLKTIAGIYPADSGGVNVKGKVAPLIEMGVGFEYEFSGRKNIKLALCYSGRISNYSKEVEEQIIDFIELGEKIDFPLKHYSSGMIARLAFAVSVFQKPDILLLDEVLATGDAYFLKKSYNLMQKKIEEVSITFIVQHSSDTIKKLCNKCMLLKNGKLLAFGDTDPIIKIYEESY